MNTNITDTSKSQIHSFKLKEAPFRLIESGLKTIELRLYDEKRQKIKPSDTILFTLEGQPEKTLIATVLKLHIFASFSELYRTLPLDKCGYTEDNITEADASDMDIYYSAEQQEKYGVVGIEIELIG